MLEPAGLAGPDRPVYMGAGLHGGGGAEGFNDPVFRSQEDAADGAAQR